MADTTTTDHDDPVLLDIGTAGLSARLIAIDDGPRLLAEACLAHPNDVALSTELVARLLQCDAREVRTAIADGTLPAVGATKKYVPLAALMRLRPITLDDIEMMFVRAAWRRAAGWLGGAERKLPEVEAPFGRRGMVAALEAAKRTIRNTSAGACR